MSDANYWIDGEPATGLDPGERIVQYGDGLFETLCVRQAVPEYLARHLCRLRVGCERLQLSFHDWPELAAQIGQLAGQINDGVIKVILGRRCAGRGYRFGASATTCIVSSHPLPDWPAHNATAGVRTRWCALRLGVQPALAGIKHLNRLEQVLARAEWRQEYAEGLLLDCNERLIEGTMSNLFVVREGVLLTPRLESCGVAGVMRSVLIDLAAQLGIEVRRQTLRVTDLQCAQEVFVCNSLIGIWPVIEIGSQHRFAAGKLTRRLQQALRHDDKSGRGDWYHE